MPLIAEPDFTAILQVLVEHVVHGRSPTNVRSLLTALDSLDAYYRLPADKKLKPGVSHLTSPGHSNLTTRFGLGTIGGGLVFEDLLKHSAKMKISPGLQVWVLGLAKDRAVLPIPKRTLKEISGRV